LRKNIWICKQQQHLGYLEGVVAAADKVLALDEEPGVSIRGFLDGWAGVSVTGFRLLSDDGSGSEAASLSVLVGVAERELLALLLEYLKMSGFNTD